jgi:hypothetical protein
MTCRTVPLAKEHAGSKKSKAGVEVQLAYGDFLLEAVTL